MLLDWYAKNCQLFNILDVKLKFDNMASEKQKLMLAKLIFENYLQNGAIAELNLDSKLKNTLSKQVLERITACQQSGVLLPQDLFKDFVIHVEFDLMDSFSRFVKTAEYAQATTQVNTVSSVLTHRLILCCK